MADPSWTRMLCPRPRSLPSADIRAAPICVCAWDKVCPPGSVPSVISWSRSLCAPVRGGFSSSSSYRNPPFLVAELGLLEGDGESLCVIHVRVGLCCVIMDSSVAGWSSRMEQGKEKGSSYFARGLGESRIQSARTAWRRWVHRSDALIS